MLICDVTSPWVHNLFPSVFVKKPNLWKHDRLFSIVLTTSCRHLTLTWRVPRRCASCVTAWRTIRIFCWANVRSRYVISHPCSALACCCGRRNKWLSTDVVQLISSLLQLSKAWLRGDFQEKMLSLNNEVQFSVFLYPSVKSMLPFELEVRTLRVTRARTLQISLTVSLSYASREQTIKRTLSAVKGGVFGVKIGHVAQ